MMLDDVYLYKPVGKSVSSLRSTIANERRRLEVARRYNLKGSKSGFKRTSSKSMKILRGSDSDKGALEHKRIGNLVNERNEDFMYEIDLDEIRNDYIKRVGSDYYEIGLKTYIDEVIDARAFRERCFSVLSRRPFADYYFNKIYSNYDINDKTNPLSSHIHHEEASTDLSYESSMNRRLQTPTRSSESEGEYCHKLDTPIKSTRTGGDGWKDTAKSKDGAGKPFSLNDKEPVPLRKKTSQSDSNEGDHSTPHKSINPEILKDDLYSQSPGLEAVLDEILLENGNRIKGVDLSPMNHTEKLKLLEHLGISKDFIANCICSLYPSGYCHGTLKPLSSFSMYGKPDLDIRKLSHT